MKDMLCLETLTEFLKLRTSIERVTTPITSKYNLTPKHAALLHLIANSENATVGSIFKELDINQGNVSTVCKKLESEGFIMRNRSSSDERICVLTLSEKGKEALMGIESALPAVLPKCDAQDNEEVQRAIEGLKALKNIAEKINSSINNKNNGE